MKKSMKKIIFLSLFGLIGCDIFPPEAEDSSDSDSGGNEGNEFTSVVELSRDSAAVSNATIYYDEDGDGILEAGELLGATNVDGELSSEEIEDIFDNGDEDKIVATISKGISTYQFSTPEYATETITVQYPFSSELFDESNPYVEWKEAMMESEGVDEEEAENIISELVKEMVDGDVFEWDNSEKSTIEEFLYDAITEIVADEEISVDDKVLDDTIKELILDLEDIKAEQGEDSVLNSEIIIEDGVVTIVDSDGEAYGEFSENNHFYDADVSEIEFNNPLNSGDYKFNEERGYRLSKTKDHIMAVYISTNTGNPVLSKVNLEVEKVTTQDNVILEAGSITEEKENGFLTTITEWPLNPHVITEFNTAYSGTDDEVLISGIEGATSGGYIIKDGDASVFYHFGTVLASVEYSDDLEENIYHYADPTSFGWYSKLYGQEKILVKTRYVANSDTNGNGEWVEMDGGIAINITNGGYNVNDARLVLDFQFDTLLDVNVHTPIYMQNSTTSNPTLGIYSDSENTIFGIAQDEGNGWEIIIDESEFDLGSIVSVIGSTDTDASASFKVVDDNFFGVVAGAESYSGEEGMNYKLNLNSYVSDSKSWRYDGVEADSMIIDVSAAPANNEAFYISSCLADGTTSLIQWRRSSSILGGYIYELEDVDQNCTAVKLLSLDSSIENGGVLLLVQNGSITHLYGLNGKESRYIGTIGYSQDIEDSNLQHLSDGQYLLNFSTKSYLVQ